MEGWFITMLVFAGIMVIGLLVHKYEENLVGTKIKIDDMKTFGSIVFLAGMIGGVFSLAMSIMSI